MRAKPGYRIWNVESWNNGFKAALKRVKSGIGNRGAGQSPLPVNIIPGGSGVQNTYGGVIRRQDDLITDCTRYWIHLSQINLHRSNVKITAQRMVMSRPNLPQPAHSSYRSHGSYCATLSLRGNSSLNIYLPLYFFGR